MLRYWKPIGIVIGTAFFLMHRAGAADVAVRAPVGNAEEAFLTALDAAVRQAVTDHGEAIAPRDKEQFLFQGAGKEATTPEEFARIGRDSGVASILVTSAVQMGDKVLLIMQLVVCQSGRSWSVTRSIPRSEALAQVGAMVAELLSNREVAPEPAPPASPSSPYRTEPRPAEQELPRPPPPEQKPKPRPIAKEKQVPAPAMQAKQPTPIPSHLRVDVRTRPSEALVSIRGQRGWYDTPKSFSLTPGSYTLVVKKPKYSAVRIPVNLDNAHALVRVKMGANHRTAGVVLSVLAGVAATVGVGTLVASTDAIVVWLPAFGLALGFGATGIHAFTKHEESTYLVERMPVASFP